MAERLSALVGDALVSFATWIWPKLAPSARRAFDQVVEAVRPDPPLTLRSMDGATTITGIAVLDRGQVLALIGSRLPIATTQARFEQDAFWHEAKAQSFGG